MTSNDLAVQDTASNMPAAPSSNAIGILNQQVEAMTAAHQLATVLSNTAMVPKTYRGKPDDSAAAILYGAEIGLGPLQSLQQIFVVHGLPSIYARTMVALVKGHGFKVETVESSDERVTVKAESPRGEVEQATWDIARATKAGYTSNAKYKSDPQAMLYSKAASEVCRKIAPDVLLGIAYSAEELELEPVKATAERVNSRDLEAITAPQVTDTTPDATPEVDAPEEVMDTGDLDATLAMIRSAQDAEELAAMRDFVGQHVAQHPQDRDTINAAWTETEAAL